ncbi:MAG: S8 family serine peptidase [Saprospiraceae bacterium]|nr:S8 family serine peptidase [Saprospiraceae bacterium]
MKMLNSFVLWICFVIPLIAQGPASRKAIHLDEAVDRYDVTGEGVVVIMIDRGIDYRHPDFIDENGKTRIAYIYDMLDPSGVDAPGNIYGIGTIYTQDQINAALEESIYPTVSIDRGGHGTATTGIMAGNGSGTDDRVYQGIAPKATIISIKIIEDEFPAFGNQPAQEARFNDLYIMDALAFAHDKITELGLPSVTLLNTGSIGGPSDGTSRISREIDRFIALGHPLVCGVGNNGGAQNYARGYIDDGETIELVVDKSEDETLKLDLWYAELDRFSVSLRLPDGNLLGPFSSPIRRDDVADHELGDITLYHRGSEAAFNGSTAERRQLLIEFRGQRGQYTVILEGQDIYDTGLFQATLNPAPFHSANRFLTYTIPGYSINDYATARTVISPTSYIATSSWTDQNRAVYDLFELEGKTGDLWIGASTGPTQDERLGVDFATPGELAIGAYYPDTWYANASERIVENSNGLYGIQKTVSAAAPIAAGLIALLLEVNPNLTPEALLLLLYNSCIQDNFTGPTPNARWGYGKLDARLALENALLSVNTTQERSSAAGIVVFPNPAKDQIYIDVKDVRPIRRIDAYNSVGQCVYSTAFAEGFRHSISIQDWPPGMYSIRVYQKEKTPMIRKIMVR